MNEKNFLGMLLVCGVATASFGQGSVWMYQGQLSDRNQPANGLYDLRFRLADAPTNGNYVGEIGRAHV